MDTRYLNIAAQTLAALAGDKEYIKIFDAMTDILWGCLASGGKILLCGNGGSAADSQHIAGELVVRFRTDRPALAGIALTVDTSVLTAALNDYGPLPVFARQVEALGRPGDVLWAFSTSGTSPNILAACEAARRADMKVIGFTARGGGRLAEIADVCFRAPTDITSHAQECHITVGHMLCDEIEKRLAGVTKS